MVIAAKTQYREEFIGAFEARQSILRDSTTTEAVISGNTATFLIAGSNNERATTRGVDGIIPYTSPTESQVSCTLSEWHRPERLTGFDIFASQGNQREIMQKNAMAVINREIDYQIMAQLATGTINTGAATTASMKLIQIAKTKLGNGSVPVDGNRTLLVTPAFMSYMEGWPEFASADYVDSKPLVSGGALWSDAPKAWKWGGMVVIEHPNLPGVGTSAAKCFLYHKNAIGHALNKAGIQAVAGYNEEQDYSYARHTGYMQGKLLQNGGVVVINHDDSALS